MRVKLGQGEMMQRAEQLQDSRLPPLDLEGRQGEEAKTDLIRNKRVTENCRGHLGSLSSAGPPKLSLLRRQGWRASFVLTG